MSNIKISDKNYQLADYKDEAEIESALDKLSGDIFGQGRFLINVKKLIGKEEKSIPDGYLLDLSSKIPELYFVEVELAKHDLIRHIMKQLGYFKLSFDQDKNKIKNLLIKKIEKDQKLVQQCTNYAKNMGYQNIHNLIDKTVFGSEYQIIIVIDDKDEEREKKLDDMFKFNIHHLTLQKFESEDEDKIYEYDLFSDETGTYIDKDDDSEKIIDKTKFDTIVVPARKEGFDRVFVGENRWWQIKFAKKMQPQIQYIAAYQTKPISQITHIAEIENVKRWENSLKYVVNFKAPAKKLSQPVKYIHGDKTKPVYCPRFAEHSKLMNAKTLDDLWYK